MPNLHYAIYDAQRDAPSPIEAVESGKPLQLSLFRVIRSTNRGDELGGTNDPGRDGKSAAIALQGAPRPK
jgi:hypothetical protein